MPGNTVPQSVSSKIAVLFFTRSPRAEGAGKQFAGDKDDRRNIRIARSLIRQTRIQIRRTGLPVFEVDEKLQKGITFGERFVHAFERIFCEGYKYVIAVGNDTPQLRYHHITTAAERLANGSSDIVLGPASDGGTWLMGYTQRAFREQDISGLPWNTSCLLESVIEQAGERFSILKLETFADIDNYGSLLSFIEKFRSNKALKQLVMQIRSILKTILSRFSTGHSERHPAPHILPCRRLRAPPLPV